MTTKAELCEILKDLSSEELEDFNLNVELEKGVQPLSKRIPKGKNAEEVVELVVEKYSEESVELIKNVLKKMNRTDLVQRLSDSSTGSKEKHSVQRLSEAKQWPSLFQRVEMITSDIEVLMDVLADLTEEEIEYFRNFLKHKSIEIHKSYVPWWQLLRTDTNTEFVGGHQETVFLMIMTCGQHSVKTTRGILKKMGRIKLLQRLTDTSSRLKKKESDEQHSALIQKVATMSAVQQLLLETLHCLSQRELSEFKKFLMEIVSKKHLRAISSTWVDAVERRGLVDEMMMTYGQQSVELTREVLENMNRTDLIQRMSETSSVLREEHSVDKHQPTHLEEAVKEDAEWILFQTLWGLSFKELEKFRFLLQFTYFQRSLPQIQTRPVYELVDLVDQVYLMVENQHPAEVTKEVLVDMKRSDLVERLSGTSSGLKERRSLDWLQTVERATSVTELLMETLADLSEEELQRFTTELEDTWSMKYTSYSPLFQLVKTDHQETVFSVILTHGQHSVEVTRKILKDMKRTDLVQRLSDSSSTPKKKDSDEQRSALIQKVATTAAVQQLLLETLHCLSQRELSEFKKFLMEIVSKKHLRTISSTWVDAVERRGLVDEMMMTYGQRSVELTREVFEKMNRTDLIQMLSESSSALKEKRSVDKHRPALLEKAVKEDAERILLQTLWGLSKKELEKFRFLLQFTYFQRSLPQIQAKSEHQLVDLVYLMVKNQHPVEVTKEVLMDMNRSDQVERLSGISSGLKERRSLDWLQTVERATSVIELLMETLADLSEEELQRFTTHLKHTGGLRYTSYSPWFQLVERNHQETVFSVVLTHGQHSVEITREILKDMKRTDLVQRLSDSSSTHKKKDSDEQRSALIQKVATMSAVQQLLLETLHCLSQRELSEFKKFLMEIVSKKHLRAISSTSVDAVERRGLVDEMMRTYGQQSVELTREVFEKMNRTDLIQMLSESSSALKEKRSVDKHRPALLEKAVRADAELILLQTLRGLSLEELEKFRFLLQFTYFQRSLPQIQAKSEHQLVDLVYLMVKNQHPVEVTKEVLVDMKRSDLVERLSGTSSGLKERRSLDWLQTVERATSVIELLMETLADLSEEELQRFTTHLKHTGGLRYTSYSPWFQLVERNHQETVFSVILTHGQHSVEITREILKDMKRTDLVQRLSDSSSTPKKKESDEQRSALIQKVATTAAVQQLLLKTLHCLSRGELSEFKKFLKVIFSKKDLKAILSTWRKRGERRGLVDLMMRTYGQRSVELTREILEEMNRTGLFQMLSESSSALKEKHFVDKQQPTLLEEAVRADAKWILLQTLRGLSKKELEKFRFLLQFTYFQRSLPQIQTKSEHQLVDLVYLMVKNQHPVEVTKEVLMDMNRSDLVERLSGTSSGVKERKSLDWLQTVETATSVTELLMETLAELSEEELQRFTTHLEDTWGLRYTSYSPWFQLVGRNHQETVFSVIMTHGQHSVEVTREILKDMKRTDLVQRLSDSSSTPKKKESDEQHSALIQKVATTAAVQQLLLETLHCLSQRELSEFKKFLKVIFSKKDLKAVSSTWKKRGERRGLVDLIMRTYGQRSVELTREVLEKMNRTDLIQMLSERSSALKDYHFVDKQQPTLLEEAVKEDAERILLQTLRGLSLEELEKFRFLLQFTYFQRSLPQIQTGPAYQLVELVYPMVENQHPVEVTKEVLMDMKRFDLVERLSGISSGLKERGSLDWLQTVETATSVIELLMETLADLSEEELQRFTTHLEDTWGLIYTSYNPWFQLVKTDHQETVFSVILTHGQHSVEITREILKDMKRTDLVQRLSDSSSTPKKKESDEQRSALIKKIATMSAVQQLLLETLHCLSQRELSEFKEFLMEIVPEEGLRAISSVWSDGVERRGLVDQMMETYGQRSVELTREVIEKMNRTDLIQMLSESSSALKERHFVDRNQPTLLEEAVKEDDRLILFQTLWGLSLKELERFKFLLKFTYFQRSLSQIQTESGHQLEDLVELVYLMVENQHPVEVAKEVLMDMNRSDLVERLSGTSSGLKGASQSEHLQKETTLTADHEQLLEILEKLSPGELEKFKHVLQYTKLRGLPKIPGHSMETADKAETVRLMVENYGQQSVDVMKDVLEILRRMDLVEKLSESSSGSQGPSGSLEPEACGGSTTDSSPWTKLEPGVNSSSGDESPTYSLQSETGNYECSVSGLRWVCEEEVSFQYHFRSWEGHMERMESIKYMPAGPLIDIKVITGRLNEVYLPHWICTEDDSKISDNFKVLHIDECGDVVENVSEVTPSHVKLSEPVFSPRGVLMTLFHWVGIPVKISCCVLIYYKPNTPFLKLRVYLIPCDPALQQTVDKKEFSKGFQTIEKPRPDKYLEMQQGFSLIADIQTAKVNPQKITLRYDNQDPNFYEVFIEKPDKNFQLELFYTSKKEVESEPVWTCEIREDDYQSPASVDKPSVDDQLSAQMQSLTNRMQAVKISTTDRERLLKILEDLTQEEFKKFKWYLQDRGVLADLTGISRSELENKDMLELVDLMLGTYRKHCMELTRRVLKAMNKNDLVEKLSDIS